MKFPRAMYSLRMSFCVVPRSWAAVHVAVNPAGEWILARFAKALVELVGNVSLGVEGLDLDAGIGEAPLVVRTHDRRDRAMLGSGGHGGQRLSLREWPAAAALAG